jgi:hypothetical protein
VFYEMLTGEKPFSGANHIALIQNVLHTDPPPPGELAPSVPDAISQVVLKCLQKSPDARYSSMDELSTVLEMTLPLERTTRKAAISRLVERHRDPESTASLAPEAGPEDVTAPFAVADLPAEKAVKTSYIESEPEPLHPLEMDPPADLPPLVPAEDVVSVPVTHSESPAVETPLSFIGKDGDGDGEAEDTGRYIDDLKKDPQRSKMPWIIPVLLLVLAGGWFLAGWMGERSALKEMMPNVVRKAHLTVVSGSGGTVFLNGEDMGVTGGGAGPLTTYDLKPGLYNLEIRHPDLGSRKYIVELKPGQSKTIEVKFGDQ